MPETPFPSGIQRRPLPPPTGPLQRPNPNAALLAEITEQVVAGLERAAAQDAAARERLAQAAGGATGTALDGAVEVSVDGKSMISGARFGPEVTGLPAEELRQLTLAALGDARDALALPSAASTLGTLHKRDAADAILRLLDEGRKR
ncbi:YbaB/EbfC family nucleoid-associated protein [Nocardioides sp. SOB77]|uniref:YbaB/EbfC family nucleoid-associated protein n=1 Tax=Nocardioides oceani TaxID=3058369 RepID=A0ABT8FL50_9ACTN|nr:YbaB/EbfC family nucleoid-associated protein [Nocardioides oceani]MDN4175399.1 YbaB/EbfC family nucleoid-associated protein [Nocardioides oceani]